MKKIDKGGITYGRSHAEGGIPVKNKSTGQMLEVEGGEGIINKKAMASPQMVKIDGKEMTICEAASYLNQKDGNGRQFNCDDVEHQQFITDHYGIGGTVMNNQDAENAIFDATVLEHGGTVGGYRLTKMQKELYNTIKNSASKSMYTYNLSFEVERALNDLYLIGLVNREYIKGTQDAKYTLKQEYATGGTTTAYDAGLHKKMYMLGIEVMQPNPIALAKAMSSENDNFCEHYPKLCSGAEYQREELPQIYDKKYEEFVAYLENLGATVDFETNVLVDTLKPVQNEISLERMARIMARVKDGYYKDLNLLKLPLFVSQDGYILDGHHRWATLFFLSPTNTLDIYRVNLTYKELVDKALNFDDAGKEKYMLGGMVKSQQQLDVAFKYPSINDKRRTSYFDIVYDNDYQDLYRMEGSSQSMMKTKITNGVTANYRNLGYLVTKLFNSYVIPTAKEFYRIDTRTVNWSYDWRMILDSIESKDKRSYAYDWFLDKRDTSFGILELFQSDAVNYDKELVEIYKNSLTVFIERVIYAVNQNSNFSSFDDFVKYLEIPIQIFAENIKNIFIRGAEIGSNSPITNFEWFTETDYNKVNRSKAQNQNISQSASAVNRNGLYSEFAVGFSKGSGEIRYDFEGDPKDCRVEFVCEIGKQKEEIKELQNNKVKLEEQFLSFLIDDLNTITLDMKTVTAGGWKISFEGEYKLWDIVRVNLQRTSIGIIDILKSEQPIAQYVNKIISTAVAEYSTVLLQMFDDTIWSSITDFKKDSRYIDAQTELRKNLSEVYSIVDYSASQRRNTNKKVKDVDFSQWLNNSTSSTSMANAGWSWRFKTEQEFVDDYGVYWETSLPNDAEWGDMDEYNMTFLFGKPITQNPTSKKVVEDLWNGTEEYRTVNVEEYFGIKNPNPNGATDFTIWESFLTNKPLQNAVVPNTVLPTTNTGWSWRFKTEEEMQKEFGNKWRGAWGSNKRDYMFGQPIPETPSTIQFIDRVVNKKLAEDVDTELLFGLSNSGTGGTYFLLDNDVITDKPLPNAVTSSAAPTNNAVRGIIEVPYLDMMYSTTLLKGQKIVGARFMTANEMKTYEKEYGTTPYGLGYITAAEYTATKDEKRLQDYLKTYVKYYTDLMGMELNPKLLPAVIENFKFQKSLSPTVVKKLIRVKPDDDKHDLEAYSRLRFGRASFMNYDFYKKLFPKVSKINYENLDNYVNIQGNEFPEWYKAIVDELWESRQASNLSTNAKSKDTLSVASDIYDPVYFLTGQRLGYENYTNAYLTIPFAYLVLKIENETSQPKVKLGKRTETIYYRDLLEKASNLKNLKITGARFLNQNEIDYYSNKYGTSKVGLEIAYTGDYVIDKVKLEDYADNIKNEMSDPNNLNFLSKMLLGKPFNSKLLPMVEALFVFDKDYYAKNKKSLFTIGIEDLDDGERYKYSRLRFGTTTFENYDFWKPLFPDVTAKNYTELVRYEELQKSKFPQWYKTYIDEVFKNFVEYEVKYANEDRADVAQWSRNWTVGSSAYNVMSILTGISDAIYEEVTEGYFTVPLSYLMIDIEVGTDIQVSTNPSAVKKLKDEYAALQYYLKAEVPIDAFAQRKLISSVMADVSNNLEKEIEALYYSPSFEPLFEFWAEKQTQGQRTINLQPCMLPTPNGEKSELDLVQYEIVRSEEFKKWFGDWEEAAVTGNYNGVSKAINPLTKEPQVVFHGKANMALEFTKMAFAAFPVKYFGTNLSYAEWFKINQSKSQTLTKLVYEFFIDLKNPIDLSPIGVTMLTAEELKEVILAQYNYQIQSPIVSEGTGVKLKLWQLIRGSQQMLQELKSNTYFDGMIMYEDNPSDTTASGYDTGLLGFSPNSYEIVQKIAGTPEGNFTLDYVTFTNFQIKAADGRNTTFFNKVEDFRFAKGGITKKK